MCVIAGGLAQEGAVKLRAASIRVMQKGNDMNVQSIRGAHRRNGDHVSTMRTSSGGDNLFSNHTPARALQDLRPAGAVARLCEAYHVCAGGAPLAASMDVMHEDPIQGSIASNQMGVTCALAVGSNAEKRQLQVSGPSRETN